MSCECSHRPTRRRFDVPDTTDVVADVFRGEPMETTKAAATEASSGSFTVRDYRTYKAVMDTPLSVSKADARQRVAEQNNITAGLGGEE